MTNDHDSQHLILMDVDTGVDDALAMLLALHAPGIELLGVTTVSGNTHAEQAARNTRFLLDRFAASAVPVRIGERAARTGSPPRSATNVHGEDGLGGASSRHWRSRSSEADAPCPDGGVEFLLQMVGELGSRLTLIATGPLTNVARAVELAPETMRRLGRLLVMGGALAEPGNVTPYAEFNAYCDPDAYAVVLGAGLPVTLFPLDVSHRVRLLREHLMAARDLASDTRQLLQDITGDYMAFHEKIYGIAGCFVHDMLPVASLLDRHAFTFRAGEVVVELNDPQQRGRTRWASRGERGGQIEVAVTVDAARILELFWLHLSSGT